MIGVLLSPAPLLTAFAIILAALFFMSRGDDKKKRLASYSGTHVFLTGGSDGLGLEICKALIEHRVKTVSLFARSIGKLDNAKACLLQLAKDRDLEWLSVNIFSGDAGKPDEVRDAISAATRESGHIDVAICAAGRAVPKYFEDMTSADFEGTMRVNFLGTVHVAQAYLGKGYAIADQEGEKNNRKTKHFVAVSSVAAAVPFIGYADYAPSKAAVKSFCDVLRNEFADDANTNIHVCFPPDMDTSGYQEELKTQPIETRQVWPEMFNELFKPQDVATDLLRAVQKGHYHVRSPDVFANLLVSRAWGHYPRGFWYGFVDFLLAPLFVLFHSGMVWMVDRCVRKHRHHERMQGGGSSSERDEQ